jgi:KUP system potassium uptake protein
MAASHGVAAPVSIRNHPAGAATLGALGIVYGDIGTSPLYALREAVTAGSSGAPQEGVILGILSLILWALILIISLKYCVFILRADNRGEGGHPGSARAAGGILALLALLNVRRYRPGTWGAYLMVVGLVGAALLYGDGAITPAISVLSALEGLTVYAPKLEPLVLPVTVVILTILFVVQRIGTAWIGRIFGPVMLIWFATLGILGLIAILKAPAVLAAINPLYALDYLAHAGPVTLAVIGGVFLVVTGGEALYADMGHFGRHPIRAAWFAIVLPSLALNYFGQGALLLADPEALRNPFYQLAPNGCTIR